VLLSRRKGKETIRRMLRKRINPNHPVFGEGYRMLNDDDTLEEGDETHTVSCLLSLNGGRWVSVIPEWKEDIGKTIGEILGPNSLDADSNERIFRRKDLLRAHFYFNDFIGD
jgi:hypothetical protein